MVNLVHSSSDMRGSLLNCEIPQKKNGSIHQGERVWLDVARVFVIVFTILAMLCLIQSFLFYSHVSYIFLGGAISCLIIAIILCIMIKIQKVDKGELLLEQDDNIHFNKTTLDKLIELDNQIVDKLNELDEGSKSGTMFCSILTASLEDKASFSEYDLLLSRITSEVRTRDMFSARPKIERIFSIQDTSKSHYDHDRKEVCFYNTRKISGIDVERNYFVYQEGSIECVEDKSGVFIDEYGGEDQVLTREAFCYEDELPNDQKEQ